MTKIEWTDKTWNPVHGCTPVSEGCRHCYAERMAKRLAGRYGYPEQPDHFKVTLREDRLQDPFRWRKPRRVFVCSMGDLFHDDVPPWYIREVWRVMARAERHTFQVLTKRIERAKLFLSGMYSADQAWQVLPPNIWLGVTAENQEMANRRVPILNDTPAAVRFVSVEPMLGPVILEPYFWWQDWDDERGPGSELPGPDWVICGGETGPGARLMHPEWAMSLRDQCANAGVPFFFKRASDGSRLLDGRLWEQYPAKVSR